MLFPENKLYAAFANIQDQARPGATTVLVLVGMDCDAVCAAHLVSDQLRKHNILYELRSVSTVQDLDDAFRDVVGAQNSEVRSVVLINCGGFLALQQRYDVPSSVFVYLIDSQRPIHHRNLSAKSRQIIVFGGEITSLSGVPAYEDDEADLLLEDSDDENEDEEEEIKTKNKDEDHSEDQNNDNDDDNDEEEQDDLDATEKSPPTQPYSDSKLESKKRASPTQSPEEARSSKRQESMGDKDATSEQHPPPPPQSKPQQQQPSEKAIRRARLRSYYAGSYGGTPAAHTLYTLVCQLQKETNSLLWYAIVGVTSRFVCMDSMDAEEYAKLAEAYRVTVQDLNRVDTAGSPSGVAEYSASLGNREGVRIEYVQKELRLLHYRHWSLMNAFMHSEDMGGSLGCWASDGNGKLNRLFAQLGVGLREANEVYAYLERSVRTKLTVQLEQHKDEFKLGEVVFPSFVKREGFEPAFSASDYACAVSALLDLPESCIGESHDAATSNQASNQAQQQARFARAYMALADSGMGQQARARDLLKEGISLSMEIQRVVVHKGAGLIFGQSVSSAGDFRYAVVESGTAEAPLANLLFSDPAGVARLATFLIRAQRASRKWAGRAALPLVLVVKTGDRAVAVGLPCPERGVVLRNGFAQHLKQAVLATGFEPDYEYLRADIVNLPAPSAMAFLMALAELVGS